MCKNNIDNKKFRAGNSGGNLHAVMSKCQHIAEETAGGGLRDAARALRSEQGPQGSALGATLHTYIHTHIHNYNVTHTEASRGSKFLFLFLLFFYLISKTFYLELPAKWK